MKSVMPTVLEVIGFLAIAVAFGVLISPWAAVAVAGVAMLMAGVLLDQSAVEP